MNVLDAVDYLSERTGRFGLCYVKPDGQLCSDAPVFDHWLYTPGMFGDKPLSVWVGASANVGLSIRDVILRGPVLRIIFTYTYMQWPLSNCCTTAIGIIQEIRTYIIQLMQTVGDIDGRKSISLIP